MCFLRPAFLLMPVYLLLPGFLLPGRAAIESAGSVTGLVTQAGANGTTNYIFQLEGAEVLGIYLHADDVVRVRWHWDGILQKDDISIARPLSEWPQVFSSVTNHAGFYRIHTDSLWIDVEKTPSARVHFRDPAGHTLLQDSAIEYDTNYSPQADSSYDSLRYTGAEPNGFKVRNTKVAPPNEAYFGLGEYSGPLNRRGETVQNWNSDAFGWDEGHSPMYKSFPFFYGVRPAESNHSGFVYGLFFNNSSRTVFRMASDDPGELSFEGGDAPVDYFFFGGGSNRTMEGVLRQYTALTGPAPMLPRWAYGYHMSKFSYSESEVRDVVHRFRTNEIPLDSIYLDIDYFDTDADDEYYDDLHQLTWNSRFPDPQGMTAYCHTQGVRVVAMVEPWLVPSDPKYTEADSLGLFVEDNSGVTQLTEIWMGPCAWMDFTDGFLRSWWQQKVAGFFATNQLDGIWNDLNETADDGKIPLDGLYELDGQFGSNTTNSVRWHQNVKNTHAIYETSVSYGALIDAYTNRRPFVLSRGGFPGIQRYAAGWSGDNTASYDHLRHNIRAGLSAMMSGMVNYGHDIGGFVNNSTAELLTRWHEWGVLNPFCRNHYSKFDPAKEPYLYSGIYRETMVESIRFRYRLMPYLYTLAHESTVSGVPMNAPTVLYFGHDTNTFSRNDNDFMVGPSLLAAPVVSQGAVSRTAYLPAGDTWYDWHDDTRYDGGMHHTVSAPMGRLPLFVRDGSIIPMGPDTNTLYDYKPAALDIHIWPDEETTAFTLYEDDGLSFDHLSNGFARAPMTAAQSVTGLVFRLAARQGQYDPGARDLALVFHDVDIWPGDSVTLNGTTLTNLSHNPAALTNQSAGWVYELASRRLHVKIPDSPTGAVVSANLRDATDSDQDGMPDWWETTHNLALADPSDAGDDPDGDTLTNLAEYRGHTDPNVFNKTSFTTAYDDMTVVGTFNDWDLNATNMHLVDDYTWVFDVSLTNETSFRFKFVANQSWANNWGEQNQVDQDLPLDGVAESGTPPDILVNGTLDGAYRFTFHEQTTVYSLAAKPGADSDGDGLPDQWETGNGLDPKDPADADADPDGDGYTSWREYRLGTDPQIADPRRTAYGGMTVAGTFNGWDQAASNMVLVGDYLWRYDTTFSSAAGPAFKFVADGTWASNWGDADQIQFLPPLNGTTDSGSSNILASGTLSGAYRFTWNEQTGAYTLNPVGFVDSDADGMADDWELAHGYDPRDDGDAAGDADGDGLSARLEYRVGGDPARADTDADGMVDGDELIAGTAIDDASSLLAGSLTSRSGNGRFTLRWPSRTGRTYTVYFAESLLDPWTPVPGQVDLPGSGTEASVTVTNLQGKGVYRIGVTP